MTLYQAISTNPYERDARIVDFHLTFNSLDRLDDKKKMKQFVETTIKDFINSADAGDRFFYKIFIPLFNRVNASVLMAKHANPKQDKRFHIMHTATKLHLLILIRQSAETSVKRNIINAKAQSKRALKTDINEAISEPLFALMISNWPKFFLPLVSSSVSELRQCIMPRPTVLRQTWP